jgi:hypothetical protein
MAYVNGFILTALCVAAMKLCGPWP